MRIEFFVKKNKKKKGWKLFLYKRVDRGLPTEKSEVVENPTITVINNQLASGVIDLQQAISSMNAEKERLALPYRRQTPGISDLNIKVRDEFWEKRYEKRDLVDKEACRHRIDSAFKAIGGLNILTASDDALILSVMENVTNRTSQRNYITVISSVLKWLGRKESHLKKPKKKSVKVKYLSLPEFKQVYPLIQDDSYALLFKVLFATGCRVGEAFAIEPASFAHGDYLSIEEQLDRKKIHRDTKNGKVRDVVVIPEFLDDVKKWAKIPHKEKLKYRSKKHADTMGRASWKAFKDLQKKVCAHDLRHSYAIYLLSKGVSIELVAQSLGDSISVAQEYYLGFTLNKESLDKVKSILSS